MAKTSVVMASYNGEKYIIPQLDSIRNQTLPFDEVIIMDDCSTDNTGSIVKQYIETYKLANWKLVINETNKGWKKNFKTGFDLATGDYIFPCDQDDIWNIEKCQRMVEIMEKHPEIGLLVSNYHLFVSEEDKGSAAYEQMEKSMVNDNAVQAVLLDPKWPYINRPGCTYCFTREFYEEIKTNWDTQFPHDAILWRYAIIMDKLALVRQPLIFFRRHGNNATTVKNRTRNERVKTFDDYIYFHKVALQYQQSQEKKEIIEKGIQFLEKRKKMYLNRNPFTLIILAFKYHEYYSTLKGIMGDLFFLIKDVQKN